MDPFLQHMARAVHDTIQHTAEQPSMAVDGMERAGGQQQKPKPPAASALPAALRLAEDDHSSSGKADMEDTHEGKEADEAAAAAIPAAAAALPRDLSFLHQHVSAYQRRIESVLAYLQEQRFGRPASSTATAAIAALRRPVAEWTSELRGMEAEWATWLLLVELRTSDETRHAQPIPPSLAERYSPQLVAQRLVGTPLHPLRRALYILHWLEELQVFLLRIESAGEVSWRRSLRRLQRAQTGDTQRDYLDPDVELRLRKAGALKPGQTEGVLDPQDLEEEQRLLEYVWALVRAGRLHEAIALCRTYGQHWRAASLQGGERCHDEGAVQPNGGVWRVGNPTRMLWRHACRALATAKGVSAVESSIYGLLGGDLPSSLSYSGQHKYDDALYCYLKLMVEEEIDQFIDAEGKGEPAAHSIGLPRPANAHLVPRDLESVLNALESPLSTSLTPSVSAQARQNPYIRLQKWLMLDDVQQAEQEMVRTIRNHYRPANASGAGAAPLHTAVASGGGVEQTINHSYLLFAVHVYLYLHPAAPHAEPLNEAGCFLVRSYLGYLESHPAQHQLVPAYAQYLPRSQRVSFYVRFLQRIPSLSERQALLAAFEEYCPAEERLEVTRTLVSNILGDEDEADSKAGAQGRLQLLPSGGFDAAMAAGVSSSGVTNLLASGGMVSAADLAKISAIDCFDLSVTLSSPLSAVGGDAAGAGADGKNSLAVVQEALLQCTQLYRSFISRDKFAAAKRFTEHLIEKRWDQHIYAILQQQQSSNKGELQMSAEWLSLEREYSHWKLYIRCLNWYDAWLTQHSSRPSAPSFHPSAYTLPSQSAQAQSDYKVFERKYASYVQRKEEWETSQRATVREAAGVFTELLQLDGGWMVPSPVAAAASSVSAAGAQEELSLLRVKCVPALVDMLMQICAMSNEHELALGIADLLASPLYQLHTCFTAEQMRALLAQFRTAYIKARLQPPEAQAGDQEQLLAAHS